MKGLWAISTARGIVFFFHLAKFHTLAFFDVVRHPIIHIILPTLPALGASCILPRGDSTGRSMNQSNALIGNKKERNNERIGILWWGEDEDVPKLNFTIKVGTL